MYWCAFQVGQSLVNVMLKRMCNGRRAGEFGGAIKVGWKQILQPQKQQSPRIAAGLCFVWCRHQESNPGPTDYKEGALNRKINKLRDFLLRAFDKKTTSLAIFAGFITWHNGGASLPRDMPALPPHQQCNHQMLSPPQRPNVAELSLLVHSSR